MQTFATSMLYISQQYNNAAVKPVMFFIIKTASKVLSRVDGNYGGCTCIALQGIITAKHIYLLDITAHALASINTVELTNYVDIDVRLRLHT